MFPRSEDNEKNTLPVHMYPGLRGPESLTWVFRIIGRWGCIWITCIIITTRRLFPTWFKYKRPCSCSPTLLWLRIYDRRTCCLLSANSTRGSLSSVKYKWMWLQWYWIDVDWWIWRMTERTITLCCINHCWDNIRQLDQTAGVQCQKLYYNAMKR